MASVHLGVYDRHTPPRLVFPHNPVGITLVADDDRPLTILSLFFFSGIGTAEGNSPRNWVKSTHNLFYNLGVMNPNHLS